MKVVPSLAAFPPSLSPTLSLSFSLFLHGSLYLPPSFLPPMMRVNIGRAWRRRPILDTARFVSRAAYGRCLYRSRRRLPETRRVKNRGCVDGDEGGEEKKGSSDFRRGTFRAFSPSPAATDSPVVRSVFDRS